MTQEYAEQATNTLVFDTDTTERMRINSMLLWEVNKHNCKQMW